MTGVSQTTDKFQDALKTCGTMDSDGDTIGMVNVTGTALRWIPLGIRVAGLLIILLMARFRQPLGFLPGDMFGIEWLSALQHWELFSTWTWLLAVVLYLVYLGVSVISKGLYRGVPGQAILFSRYGKVVKTLIPGEFAYIVDPRVVPAYVICTKPMVLDLDPVEGITVQNVTTTSRGSLFFNVEDTRKLVEQGGFSKFFMSVQGTFKSAQQDLVLKSSADEFNRYMIEPAQFETQQGANDNDIDARLEQIEQQNLSAKMLVSLSEISNLDVSKIDLTEPNDCSRKGILLALAADAQRFGIVITDYVPQGNLVEGRYLVTLMFNLVQWVQRLKQASRILKEISQQEIEEEINSRVADKQRGLLQLTQLCNEILSLINALKDENNLKAIIEATESKMKSEVTGTLALYVANIEALVTKARANRIDTAGLERFVAESEAFLSSLEKMDLPHVGTVVLNSLAEDSIIPKIDIIGAIINNSGIQKEIDKLSSDEGNPDDRRKIADGISKKAGELDTVELIRGLQTKLGEVKLDTGIDITRFTPDEVSRKISMIESEIARAERTAPDDAAQNNNATEKE
jgi:hypothetical protein